MKLRTFNGVFQHKVDAKGRVSLPAPWRRMVEGRTKLLRSEMGKVYDDLTAKDIAELFEEEIHLVMAADKSHMVGFLSSYIEEEAEKLEASAEGLSQSEKERSDAEEFNGPSKRSKVDSAGRIGISRRSIDKLGLQDQPCVFRGLGRRFELYNADAYVAMRRKDDPEFELEDELS